VNDRSNSGRVPDRGGSCLPPDASLAPSERRILDVAVRLFAKHGFHRTSMRDLASVLEIQPSALYVSFPSKDHLLAELVRVGHEVHLDRLRKALLQGNGDPVEQLRAVVRANTLMHVTYPHLAIIVNDEMHALPSELLGPGLALRRQSAAMLSDIIERGTAMKRFTPPNPMVTAAAIGAMSLRIPHWYREGDGIEPEALADIQAELALRMLGARP
jgi:AcrR family transcriptional regulator